MQDHEFEKQVHQKMEEIKILPSDAVWKEVEIRLHPKSKSRRLIWFPFLLFGLAIGGYLIYIYEPASNQSLQSGRDPSYYNTNRIKHDKEGTKLKEGVKSKRTNYKERDTTEITASSAATTERFLSEKDKKPATSRQLKSLTPATHSGRYGNKTDIPEKSSPLQGKGMNRNIRSNLYEELPVDTRRLHQTESLFSVLPDHKTEDGSDNMMIIKEPVPARVNPLKAWGYPVNTSLALHNLRAAVNAPAQKDPKRSGWKWGFSVRAGQLSVTNGKFTNLFAREAVADVNNSFSSGNQSVSPSVVYIPPSALKPGPGYSAGVLITKQLTRRTSFSTGLQYTRFSTSHKVGKRITDSIVTLRNNSADQKSIEEYFRVGNTDSYQNKYHFFELPVLFETRLTGFRFVPVYWDFGVSVSRLISSNALHYNGNSKIYYEDNSLFNRNQFSVISGLPVRILSEERFTLKTGPVFQYNISNLIDKAQSGGRHFLFIGVKADIILFK